MDAITSLPSLTDLLSQNPNLQPNVQANRFAQNAELSQLNNIPGQALTNGVQPIKIDKTSSTERVTAPGFAQMFEDFVKGVDQKKKISKQLPFPRDQGS